MLLFYSTMILQLVLIYCGAYHVVKQLLRAQSAQLIGTWQIASQFLMLLLFANVCFFGVWHPWLTWTQLLLAVLFFNAGMALPAGCAHAMHMERLQVSRNPRNRGKPIQ
ncbi:MAG: hypothetical protein QE278_11850 [Limnobacter sp.]|nr:hypothetical protein [Limnobacter sp.]